MHVLFDVPDFIISYDASHNWLYTVWRGTRPTSQTRDYCARVAAHAQLTGSNKVLNDSVLDLDGWGELTKWIAQDFFHTLFCSGVAAVAWVLPHDLRARTYTNEVIARLSQLRGDWPVVDTFADMEAAYAWLMKVPVPGQPRQGAASAPA